MQHWHFKPLGDGIWVDTPSDKIKQLFRPLFESTGRPAEMMVFARHEEGSLHCEWIAYFSPAAEDVAMGVEAVRCEKPIREGLNLLAGMLDNPI